jgi:hypothetical protein
MRNLFLKPLNLLACPGDVFEEVAAGPPCVVNWLAPTLLVALTSLLLLCATSPKEPSAIRHMLDAGKVSAEQALVLSARWRMISWLTVGLAAFAGTFWSAFLLWSIGRLFLKVRFPFFKSVEIVGLSGSILALGAVVTLLLIAATGDVNARPALSLLVPHLGSANPVRAFLGVLNVFHLWTTTVLAIGLSKLSGVSFKEAAYWVFGYWLVVRMVTILLA